MGTKRYVVNSPAVVGEIIDDEAVILDLKSGRYFNTEGAGATIWAGIEQGGTQWTLAQLLVNRFDLELPHALEHVGAFLAVLERNDLVRAEEGEATAPPRLLLPPEPRARRSARPNSRCIPISTICCGSIRFTMSIRPVGPWPTARPENARHLTRRACRA